MLRILHHSQQRVALLRMVRVLAAHDTAKTHLLRKVQNLKIQIKIKNQSCEV